jgi:hypothetical protein
VHYLRSIHVSPKGLVIQRGLRNYAGTRCPGRGWTCTRTTHPVVQVARRGGGNMFTCSTARCVVVQVALAPARQNKGVCIKTTGLTQSCVIVQSSATMDNLAVVYEDAGNKQGLTQTASYTASITQTATGPHNRNQACVHQVITLLGNTNARRGTPVNVSLEAHQSVTVTQDAIGTSDLDHPLGGSNSAQASATSDPAGVCTSDPLTQVQTLTSIATGTGPITQYENMAQNGANVALDIEQNQRDGFKHFASGVNNAIFSQTNTLTAVANTPAGEVKQTQSSFVDPQSPLNGGLLGTVNQDSTGVETADATQTETQCEDATTGGVNAQSTCDQADMDPPGYTLTQKQYGPVGNAGAPVGRQLGRHQPHQIKKGDGNSIQSGGNAGDTFTITQSSQQDTDQGSGSIQQNSLQADCQTSGNCTATQSTNIDGTPSSNTQSGQDVQAQMTCSGTECTPSGTDFNILIAGTGDFSNGTPTEPNDNLTQALTAAGYSVTELPTLPADLSSFGQVWWVSASPMTTAEQNQLINFEETGRGVYLTGERPCCEDLNAADQTIVNSVVSGGGITVGNQGDVCGCNSPLPVNPTVVGNLATQPHTVTSWQPNAPGGMAGVPASSVFSYYQPDEFTTQVAAAAWDRPSTVGQGRLAVFMDVNWPEAASRAANWSDVAENVALFLSGRSSPPSPPGPDAPISELSRFGPLAQTTPARATSPASGGASSTR